jgi:hypothetical protein
MLLWSFLAAWGLMSLLWVIAALFLPRENWALVCRCGEGRHPDGAIARYTWLRGLGLVQGPLWVIGCIPPQEQRIWHRKHPDVVFLSEEEFSSLTELERTI